VSTTLPVARSFNEAILFIRLRPCRCGEMEAGWRDVHVLVGDQQARSFTGTCYGCARPRGFTIAMPPDAKQTLDVVYGEGDEPSLVLDPGEWLGVSDLYGQQAEELLGDDEFGEDDDVNSVYYALSARVSAFDEILKFLPPGAAAVPEWRFRSIAGRTVYEALPERFERTALLAERAALKANLDRFVRDFGGPDDGE
jgi:hypothetical protein